MCCLLICLFCGCLWPISLHFVYTDFFFFFFRDTQGWFNLMETLDHLPAAASSVGERGPRSHRVTPGAEHWARQSLRDAAAHLASTRGAGVLSSSSKLLSSPPIPTGQWEKGARLFQPLLFVPALGLASHPPLPTGGKFEGPSQAQDKVFRPVTRRNYNSGELAEILGFFSVILETGWGNSCSRTKATAYKLLRKDRKGRSWGGVMLFVKEWSEDAGKSTGQLSAFGSKSEVSPSRECLWWVSWMGNLIGKEKQMKSSSDHLKTDNGSLGCSDKIVEFNILRGVKKVSSRIKPQNFTRADFNLLREMVGGIPEEPALETKGVQEYWETFRDCLLKVQEQSIHLSRKRSWHSKKPAWLNNELLREPRCKKGTWERWKREQASKGEYWNTTQAHRDAERKAKAQLEPKLARDVKSSKKVLTYCMYVSK